MTLPKMLHKRPSKRGGGTTSYYYMGLIAIFIVLGAWVLIKMGGAFGMENAKEGVGFRQAAVIQAYQEMDSIMLYTQTAADFAVQEGFVEYLKHGMKPRVTVDGDVAAPCGYIGTYTAWNSLDERECYGSLSTTAVDPVLAQYLQNRIREWWHHPVLRDPVPYEFSYSFADGTVSIIGNAQEEVVLPVLGIKGKSIDSVDTILSQERLARGVRATFDPDSPLVTEGTDPDSDRRVRRQAPTYIVLHYTASWNLKNTVANFHDSELSIHYIVGRDGKIIQMVPENEVAYHAGGCGENKCVMESMNDKAIGIEIINLGWLNPKNTNNNRPLTKSSNNEKCPEASSKNNKYVDKPRDCNYDSYNNYPNNGYEGKKLCENEPSDICWETYSEEQLEAVYALVADIMARWNIPAENVIGHDQIKAEKYDPGPAFPWEKLAEKIKNVKPADPNQQQEYVPPQLNTKDLKWPSASMKVSSCYDSGEQHIKIQAERDTAVYAIGDGRVVTSCKETCPIVEGKTPQGPDGTACKPACGGSSSIIINHGNIFSYYSGLHDIPEFKDQEQVSAGGKIGRVLGTEFIFGIADSEENAKKQEGTNPFCYYTDDLLGQLKETGSAADCKASYTVDNSVLMTKQNPALADECKEVSFQGVQQSSCFQMVDEISVQTNANPMVIKNTEDNLREYSKKLGIDMNDMIKNAAKAEDIQPAFLYAIITKESQGNPYAVSYSGCAGLTQFCSGTAVEYDQFRDATIKSCKCTSWEGSWCTADTDTDNNCCWYDKGPEGGCPNGQDDRFDPVRAIPAAAEFLAKNLETYKKYRDKYQMAAAHYNSGGNASRDLESEKTPKQLYPGILVGIEACTNDLGKNYDTCVAKYGKECSDFVEGKYEACVSQYGQKECSLPSWSCVKEFVRPQGRDYSSKVIGFMADWGGAIEKVNIDVECADVTTKNLGTLRFKPNFKVEINDAITPVMELIDWTVDTVQEIDDDLMTSLAYATRDQDEHDWSFTFGFCEDYKPDEYLAKVMLGLQECQANNQEDCYCQVLPDPEGLEEGEYQLTFMDDARVELSMLGDNEPAWTVATDLEYPLTNYLFQRGDTEEVFEIKRIWWHFTVEKDDGKMRITEPYMEYAFDSPDGKMTVLKEAIHPPVEGFSKMLKDDLWGVFDVPKEIETGIFGGSFTSSVQNPANNLCLPTRRLYPLCAELEVELSDDGTTIKPRIKYGIALTDKEEPDSVKDLVLNGTLDGQLKLSFGPPEADDLSGVLIYCSEGDFKESSHYYPIRLTAAELEELVKKREEAHVELTLEHCNGEPITQDPTIIYHVRVNSFDYGANEPEGPEDSFTFSEDWMELYMGGHGALLG